MTELLFFRELGVGVGTSAEGSAVLKESRCWYQALSLAVHYRERVGRLPV